MYKEKCQAQLVLVIIISLCILRFNCLPLHWSALSSLIHKVTDIFSFPLFHRQAKLITPTFHCHFAFITMTFIPQDFTVFRSLFGITFMLHQRNVNFTKEGFILVQSIHIQSKRFLNFTECQVTNYRVPCGCTYLTPFYYQHILSPQTSCLTFNLALAFHQ